MKLAQIKEQVAALLDVELVYSGEVRQVLNTELNNTELSKANWNTKATWETALSILNNAKYDRKQMRQEGVKEDLGSQCGGSLQPNSLITDTSNSNQDEIGAKHCNTKGQEYRLFLPEVIPAIVDKLDDNNTYKVDRGTGHTPVVYHLCVDNKDGQTKLLVIIGSWLALSTIQMYYRDNLISKALKPEQQTTVNQDKVNSSEVNYIVTLTDYPQVVIKDDYNPKELTEVTEEQLLGSLYTDKTTAEMMFPGSYYQVLEVNPNNIKQQLMNHYNLEETSDIVATVTSDNITEFKGILVEHVTKYDIGLDYPETINDVLLTKFPNYWLVNKSEDVLQFNSFSNAVKHIKEWLGVKQQQVPSTEEAIQPFNYSLELTKLKSLSRQEFMALIQEVQHVKHFSSYYLPKWEVVETYFTKEEYELATNTEQIRDDDDCHWLKLVNIQDCFSEAGNYHYSQMQLTPKLELFSLMTEFVFLMECYLELTTYFFNLSSSIYDANHQLYLTWNIICSICFKRYVCMPSKGDSTYGILLRIHNQAMKQSSLERKSIYV